MTDRRHCELCEAAKFTHWYYEDDVCWIADCEVCVVPMVVWKKHGVDPPPGDLAHMLEKLELAGHERFGSEKFHVDQDMRTIPDHFHAHARDHDWFRHRVTRKLVRFSGIGAPRNDS